MKMIKMSAAFAAVLLASGCATQAKETLKDGVGASQATSQIAVEAANVASEEARKAMALAEQALAEAKKANACCATNKSEFSDKLDSMFKKSMYK